MHQGHRQGRGYQLGTQVMREGPSDDSPTVQIHDHGQIQPAFLGCDVGDIAHPNLIAPGGFRQLGKPVRSDRFIMEAIGRLRPVTPLRSATQPELAPNPIDPFPAVLVPSISKLCMQPRGSIGTMEPKVNVVAISPRGKIHRAIVLAPRDAASSALSPQAAQVPAINVLRAANFSGGLNAKSA